jgi:hypothetical protein
LVTTKPLPQDAWMGPCKWDFPVTSSWQTRLHIIHCLITTIQSAEICGPVELTAIDADTGDSYRIIVDENMIMDKNILFTTESITPHRLYNITVNVNNETISHGNMSK